MTDLKKELSKALNWESAHVGFQKATEGLQLVELGKLHDQQPYTIWQLAEHIRIAQEDIIDFCVNPNYQAADWPDDYWPDSKAPSTERQWQECREAVKRDRSRMISLIEDESAELFKPFPHGDGQHLFRQALLIIDHEAYHTGQIIVLRKILGVW